MSDDVAIESLPIALSWQSEPVAFGTGSDSVWAEAAGKTDLFVDPGSGEEDLSAPRLVGQVVGDFMLSARVVVDFRSTFDAGVLLLWAGERSWAKLCFELAPRRKPTVVSVVTRGVSDDCNSFATEGDEMRLRVSRLGDAFAFHASTDGESWELVRYFALDLDVEPYAGFLVQSPRGAGCSARFEEIAFAARRLPDIRSGE